MLEEDDGNISAGDMQNIDNAMFNAYQVAFWKPAAEKASYLRMMLLFAVFQYLGNDDLVATAAHTSSTAGTWIAYDGDGGHYKVQYQVV